MKKDNWAAPWRVQNASLPLRTRSESKKCPSVLSIYFLQRLFCKLSGREECGGSLCQPATEIAIVFATGRAPTAPFLRGYQTAIARPQDYGAGQRLPSFVAELSFPHLDRPPKLSRHPRQHRCRRTFHPAATIQP